MLIAACINVKQDIHWEAQAYLRSFAAMPAAATASQVPHRVSSDGLLVQTCCLNTGRLLQYTD